MKKHLYLFLVLALLASVLPAAALAAKPAELEVEVRNQTGAPVDMSLTDSIGNVIYKTLPVGTSTMDLTEGRYTYFAATACGNQSGPFNAVIGKVLYVECDGGPVVMYEKCQFVAYNSNNGDYYDPGINYRWWRSNGYPYGYEYYLLYTWAFNGQVQSCVYGMQAKDYFDGVKPGDTKPAWFR